MMEVLNKCWTLAQSSSSRGVLPPTGERLSAGWDPILRLLEAVPQGEEADTVGLAFQSVQLLCSDYMSNLGVVLLKKCVEVAALYGSQQVRDASCACPARRPEEAGSLQH